MNDREFARAYVEFEKELANLINRTNLPIVAKFKIMELTTLRLEKAVGSLFSSEETTEE